MDKINEQMYKANVDLVEKNRILEIENKKILKRFDKCVEYLKEHKPVCSTASILNILLEE